MLSNASGGKNTINFLNGIIAVASMRTLRIVFKTHELPEWIDDGKWGVNLLFDETLSSPSQGGLFDPPASFMAGEDLSALSGESECDSAG